MTHIANFLVGAAIALPFIVLIWQWRARKRNINRPEPFNRPGYEDIIVVREGLIYAKSTEINDVLLDVDKQGQLPSDG